MKFPALMAQLAAAGLQAHVIPTCKRRGDGGKLVVTPHGGRILGVFTHAEADNAFWVHPKLASDPGSLCFIGGDRLWIAPEIGLFHKGKSLADGSVIQPAIDPGNWIVGHQDEGSIRLVNNFSATYFHDTAAPARGTVERSIRRICRPVVEKLPEEIHFSGYEIASRFELLESPQDELHFGMWFLMQMVVPHGGYLYAPTYGRAVVTGDYYEPTGPDYLRVADNHVRFKLDSIHRHKIGIRKHEVTGRCGFLSLADASGQATLAVRNFLNNPSGHYSDVPFHTPAGTQDCIQSYSDNSGPGGFGELEYHAPGVNRRMAEPVSMDVNQVWIFTGPRTGLVPLAAKLLNLPADTFAV